MASMWPYPRFNSCQYKLSKETWQAIQRIVELNKLDTAWKVLDEEQVKENCPIIKYQIGRLKYVALFCGYMAGRMSFDSSQHCACSSRFQVARCYMFLHTCSGFFDYLFEDLRVEDTYASFYVSYLQFEHFIEKRNYFWEPWCRDLANRRRVIPRCSLYVDSMRMEAFYSTPYSVSIKRFKGQILVYIPCLDKFIYTRAPQKNSLLSLQELCLFKVLLYSKLDDDSRV